MQQPAASRPDPVAESPVDGERVRECNVSRWHVILTKHYPQLHHRLLSFARSRVSCDHTGEDLVQELYAQGPRIVPEGLLQDPELERLFSYLCGCLRRFAAKQHERRERRARLRTERFHQDEIDDRLKRALSARLHCEDALAVLSEQDRRLLWLRFAEGWYPREIADRLGTSADWVSVRIHRALVRVRKYWAGPDGRAPSL